MLGCGSWQRTKPNTTDTWMDGDRWTDGWVDRWTDGWMDGHPTASMSTGRSCMRLTWSCRGNENTLRSWSLPLTATVSGAQLQPGLEGALSAAWNLGCLCLFFSSSADRGAAGQSAEEGCRPAGHGGTIPPLRGQGTHGEDASVCSPALDPTLCASLQVTSPASLCVSALCHPHLHSISCHIIGVCMVLPPRAVKPYSRVSKGLQRSLGGLAPL